MTIIANKYKLLEILGNGAFGYIYKAKNVRNGRNVALKIEPLAAETKMLKNETKVYQYLNGIEGIPNVFWFGVDDKNYYMAMELLGDSLHCVRKKSKTFSLDNIIYITTKMIKILECLHKKGLIHRDVKPDNFLLGPTNEINKLFLIDFGLCKKYILEDGITHIPLRENRTLVGTPNFVSINIHNGYEPSRRDDLESIAYIMLYLINKSLMWYNPEEDINNINDINNNNKIKNSKIETMMNEETPEVIRNYFNYCRNLTFDERPDYELIFILLKT